MTHQDEGRDHGQPLREICILDHSTDPDKLVLSLEAVSQPHGTGDTYDYQIDRYRLIGWLKNELRRLDPTPKQEILEVLRRIEDRLSETG